MTKHGPVWAWWSAARPHFPSNYIQIVASGLGIKRQKNQKAPRTELYNSSSVGDWFSVLGGLHYAQTGVMTDRLLQIETGMGRQTDGSAAPAETGQH